MTVQKVAGDFQMAQRLLRILSVCGPGGFVKYAAQKGKLQADVIIRLMRGARAHKAYAA